MYIKDANEQINDLTDLIDGISEEGILSILALGAQRKSKEDDAKDIYGIYAMAWDFRDHGYAVPDHFGLASYFRFCDSADAAKAIEERLKERRESAKKLKGLVLEYGEAITAMTDELNEQHAIATKVKEVNATVLSLVDQQAEYAQEDYNTNAPSARYKEVIEEIGLEL